VPEVVAADTERSWLLMRDGGVRIADSGDLEVFPRALALYGELQVGEVSHVDELLAIGSDEGAAALGIAEWQEIEIDESHPQLRGVDEPLCALVHGCSADVVRPRSRG